MEPITVLGRMAMLVRDDTFFMEGGAWKGAWEKGKVKKGK